MWYLLYNPIDSDFELFLDNAPNSITHSWFEVDEYQHMFQNPHKYRKSVNKWLIEEWDTAFILHSFLTQPTQDEVIAAIHSHPELLI